MKYTWYRATGNDVADIVKMAQSQFESEINTIYTPDPVAYSRNITLAVVNQFYLPMTNLLAVTRDSAGKLLAYTWASNNERAAWSDDVMISIRMAHLDLDLNTRKRVELLTDMMELWEQWARECKTPIICSTTMRNDQQAFLKLHRRHNYDVRGSFAYKRIDLEKKTQ